MGSSRITRRLFIMILQVSFLNESKSKKTIILVRHQLNKTSKLEMTVWKKYVCVNIDRWMTKDSSP